MNTKNSMLMAVLFLFIAGVLFLGLSGRGGGLFREKSREPAVRAALSEHQGHGLPPVQSQAVEPDSEALQSAAAFPEEAPAIEIPEEGQRLIGVKTAVVAEQSLDRTIRTVGRVEYDERRIATVNTKIAGWIEHLRVNYTGRYVKKGEVLAEIYSPELIAGQQEYLNSLKWSRSGAEPAGAGDSSALSRMLAQDAEAMRKGAFQRLRFFDLTAAQIRTIEETGVPLRTLAVFSPVSGYVVQKSVVQGMKVQPGEKLFDLVDTATVWLVADIYEHELAQIKTGQQAEITVASLPGRTFAAAIEYVSPVLAAETRTAKVRFTLHNQDGALKPQMFANVALKIALGTRLVVPDGAVINTGARQLVYVDKGEGYFEPREVSLGVKAEGMSEILSGVQAGEKVASAATFLIDSEARLKGVVKE